MSTEGKQNTYLHVPGDWGAAPPQASKTCICVDPFLCKSKTKNTYCAGPYNIHFRQRCWHAPACSGFQRKQSRLGRVFMLLCKTSHSVQVVFVSSARLGHSLKSGWCGGSWVQDCRGRRELNKQLEV